MGTLSTACFSIFMTILSYVYTCEVFVHVCPFFHQGWLVFISARIAEIPFSKCWPALQSSTLGSPTMANNCFEQVKRCQQTFLSTKYRHPISYTILRLQTNREIGLLFPSVKIRTWDSAFRRLIYSPCSFGFFSFLWFFVNNIKFSESFCLLTHYDLICGIVKWLLLILYRFLCMFKNCQNENGTAHKIFESKKERNLKLEAAIR